MLQWAIYPLLNVSVVDLEGAEGLAWNPFPIILCF